MRRRLFEKVTPGWVPTGIICLLFRDPLNSEGCCWETLVSAPLDPVPKGPANVFSCQLELIAPVDQTSSAPRHPKPSLWDGGCSGGPWGWMLTGRDAGCGRLRVSWCLLRWIESGGAELGP